MISEANKTIFYSNYKETTKMTCKKILVDIPVFLKACCLNDTTSFVEVCKYI